MTQVGPEVSVIELGEADAEDRIGGFRLPAHLRRRLLVALVSLLCVLALAASVPGRPGLTKPLWTGSVSLNGFTIGAHGLYLWRPDGKAVSALDPSTGRPRWSRDISELPESIMDLGNGVVVVATQQLSSIGANRPGFTVSLVREETGERIAATTGDYYIASTDGRLLLVFSQRLEHPDVCGTTETYCADVTAWDARTGTVAWKLSLAPDAYSVESLVGSRAEALADIAADGTVQLRDLSSGAVAGSVRVPRDVSAVGGQVGLIRDALLTAERGPDGITITAYRRPSLTRTWSVVVPDNTATNDHGDGQLSVGECGPDVCLTVHGGGFWVINPSTGSATTRIALEPVLRLGAGVFLAVSMATGSVFDGTPGRVTGFVVDPSGRTLATLDGPGLVQWSDSGDRSLVTREGPDRTEFRLVDARGIVRSLGSVSGIRLACEAHADILACSDRAGGLRVWRLPI
jgi:outer membrane protein assembly factor BamB